MFKITSKKTGKVDILLERMELRNKKTGRFEGSINLRKYFGFYRNIYKIEDFPIKLINK